eukprot:1818989-Prymnesium_polylepis.1
MKPSLSRQPTNFRHCKFQVESRKQHVWSSARRTSLSSTVTRDSEMREGGGEPRDGGWCPGPGRSRPRT